MEIHKRNIYNIIIIFLICLIMTSCKGEKAEDTASNNEKTNNQSIDKPLDNEEVAISFPDDSINYEEWLYFGNPDDNYKIYRMKTDGTSLVKLADARYEGFGSLQEWVYFVDTQDKYTPSKLARIKWDGTNKEIITEENVDFFSTSDTYVFYTFENNIYRINKDGTLKTKIISSDEKICFMKYYKDTIYFSTSEGLYSINTDGTDLYLVLEGNIPKFDISNDKIYYYDNKLYRSTLKGIDEREILDLNVSDVFVLNDMIYYNQGDYLYRVEDQNAAPEKIFIEEYLTTFYDKDDYIYFYGSGRIWRVKTDLSQKEIFLGTGREQQEKMYIKVDDKIITKNYDAQEYTNGDLTYKLYEVVGDDAGKKISDIAIDIFESHDDHVYYTDAKDKKLYKVDVNSGEKQLIIDEMIGSFLIYNQSIYYTDISNNYKLYQWDSQSGESHNITNIAVSNIKRSDNTIYFIDNNKRMGMFVEGTSNISRYVDIFTTTYDILDDTIYYKNEDDDGKLYRMNNDGSENIKMTDNTVKDIYAYQGNIYYIEKNGTNLLYRVSNNKTEGEFLDIIGIDYMDMEIIDGVLFIATSSEGSSYYTIERYLDDLKYKVFYNITKQIDSKWKYFIYDIYNFMGYLYKYNVDTNEIRLVTPKWVSNFQIVDQWIYYSGYNNMGNYSSYIDRIHLKSNETDTIISIDDPAVDSISYKVLNDYIYYFLDKASDGSIWKRSLLDGTQNRIVDDSSRLEDIVSGWLYYQNTDEKKKIVRVSLDGTKKELLTNNNSKYVHATKDALYYLFITEEDPYRGVLVKRLLNNETEQVIIQKKLSYSDLVVVDHMLYFNDKGIKKYDLRTGKTITLYEREVDYFTLVGNTLNVSIHDGDKYETVSIPIK